MNQAEWGELKLIEARLSEVTQRIGELEMDQQAKLFSLLRELDQVNVNIGHAKYMVNHFEHEWRSADTTEDFIHNHQAMMLCHKHMIQLQAQRDELEGYINYLWSQQ